MASMAAQRTLEGEDDRQLGRGLRVGEHAEPGARHRGRLRHRERREVEVRRRDRALCKHENTVTNRK